MPEKCFSDLGSNLVAAADIVQDFINDVQTQAFFRENNIESLKFENYFKGCSKLGGLVESCVKISKRLIFGAIKNAVLNYDEFVYLIAEITSLINKRPVAFKDSLRDCAMQNEIPLAIAPEILIHGYELVTMNIIPHFQIVDTDATWSKDSDTHIVSSFNKLQSARARLTQLYSNEFVQNLFQQASNQLNRYKPTKHHPVKIGDLVLLKDTHVKPSQFQMARVVDTISNDLEEVTGITARKGNSRQMVKRHISSVIPLFTDIGGAEQASNNKDSLVKTTQSRPVRATANAGRELIRSLIKDGSL